MKEMTPRRLAEDLVEITVRDPSQAQKVAERLRQAGCFDEVVPALTNVTVLFSPLAHTYPEIERIIEERLQASNADQPQRVDVITLPIVYGGAAGPDLDHVAEALELPPDKVIEAHASQTHHVDMMGFTPGFAYMSGMNWSVPRLSTPKAKVAAGSVGVAGGRTGIYSLGGPGGWPIIGRTSTQLFDAQSSTPFLLSPGVRVRFQSVDA